MTDYRGPCTEADRCVMAEACPLYQSCRKVEGRAIEAYRRAYAGHGDQLGQLEAEAAAGVRRLGHGGRIRRWLHTAWRL
jgi:hypothetical protein